MPIPELLLELLAPAAPSGHEAPVAAVWRRHAAAFAEVGTDAMGSSFARVAGRGEGPTVALLGHVDEIGVVVTHVEDGGMLAFGVVGGYNPDVLVGQRLRLLTRGGELPGLVARRRLRPDQIRDRPATQIDDLHVDVGARDGDEARALVRVGDPGVLVGEPLELRNGRIASRALDNRLGAYAVLEAARRIAEAGGAAGDVVAVASVQEEIGLFGARAGAFGLAPDAAIAVDVTPASDVPGGDPRRSGAVSLGGGPTIDRGPTLNPRLVELLVETAEAEGIAVSYEVSTRATNTDADEVHAARAGIPTALVSIPLRYVHTPVELAQLSDVEETAALVAAAVLRLDASTSLAR